MHKERVRTHLLDGVLDIALGDPMMTARQSAELVELLAEYSEDENCAPWCSAPSPQTSASASTMS